MSGQMKTFLDRMNPLYAQDYNFKKVYMMTVAADDDEKTPERAVFGMKGWVYCFENAEFAQSLFCGGLNNPSEVKKREEYLNKAFEFGKLIEL